MSIGKSDKVERNSASFAQQADSVVAHRTMDAQQHTTSDNVLVAKPPDLTSGCVGACNHIHPLENEERRREYTLK